LGDEKSVATSTFVPGEGRCQCLVEAPNADLIEDISDAAAVVPTTGQLHSFYAIAMRLNELAGRPPTGV
jgi:hypothetical protein